MLSANLSMRLATLDDELLIFNWRNTQEIIDLSSSKKPVQWSEHQQWFLETINDVSSIMFIAEYLGLPIGQVRFDHLLTTMPFMTIYLQSKSVGKGYGSFLIPLACQQLKESFPHVQGVYAIIRAENTRSIKAFKKSGFCQMTKVSDRSFDPLLKMVLYFE